MNANQVISFNLTDAGLAELSAKYLPLTVSNPDDTDGYHAVKTARLDVKARRVAVEKTRVEMKADALEYGRRVDAEAKRITAKLTHIESHLEAQEAIVTNELARRKKLEEEKKAAATLALGRRPDRLKLLGVADALDAITVPKVSEEAAGLACDIANRIDDLAGDIRALVDKFAAEVDEARELARV